jgi:hypothetical protein
MMIAKNRGGQRPGVRSKNRNPASIANEATRIHWRVLLVVGKFQNNRRTHDEPDGEARLV